MGSDNPTNLALGGGEDGLDVGIDQGTGIQHRNVFGTQQIGIGTGAGHHPRVGSGDTPNPAIQTNRDTGLKSVGHTIPAMGTRGSTSAS